MRIIVALGAIALTTATATACGSDEETEGEKVCREVEAKLDECQLTFGSGVACNTSGDEAVLCAARCLIDAECGDITATSTDNPYILCVAECSGADPDDFICASGNAFIPQVAVCDGTPHCPDGSDEEGCGGGDGGVM